jgi:drug/metabolite transporter (DMT)-like permease
MSDRARLAAALATLYVAWGSTYLAIRVLVETVPPLLSAGLRFVAAGAILAAWIAARPRRRPTGRREALNAAGISTLTIAAAFALLFAGETEVPSGLSALLIASVPLWVVLLRLGTGARVPPVTLAAVALGFAGVAVLALPGHEAGAPIPWMLVVVGAAAAEAVGSFAAQRVKLPADLLASTAIQMLSGGALTIAVALAIGEAGDLDAHDVTGDAVLAFLYLVGPGSLLAYTAYVWLLKNAPISTVTTYAYVNPVVAVFLGWAVLSEDVTPTLVAGAAAIVASVALVVRAEGHSTSVRE